MPSATDELRDKMRERFGGIDLADKPHKRTEKMFVQERGMISFPRAIICLLTGGRMAWPRCLRQGSAPLFFGLVIGILNGVEPSFGTAISAICPTKTCSPNVIVGVRVANPSHHIEVVASEFVASDSDAGGQNIVTSKEGGRGLPRLKLAGQGDHISIQALVWPPHRQANLLSPEYLASGFQQVRPTATSVHDVELTSNRVAAGEQGEYDQLQKGNETQHHGSPKKPFGESSDPPIIRRFILLVLGVGGGLLLTLVGWHYFYDNRRLLGAALVGGGTLAGLLGAGLWLANAFHSTWGWLL